MSEEFEPQPEPHPSSEESIFESDSKKLNPWTIIETYFRDNPNYKSQHQIDSY